MSILKGKATEEVVRERMEADSLDATLDQLDQLLRIYEPDLTEYCSGIEFSGFNKEEIGRLCAKRFGGIGTMKILLLGVKRGTNLEKIMSNSNKMDAQIKRFVDQKKLLANGKGSGVVTVGRVLATFPHQALKLAIKYQIPKKINDTQCPAALQFPAAASLPMSATVRTLHVEFCMKFGKLIKSPFDEGYYKLAFAAQVDPSKLDETCQTLLGSPTLTASVSVDIEHIFKTVKESVSTDVSVMEPKKPGGQRLSVSDKAAQELLALLRK